MTVIAGLSSRTAVMPGWVLTHGGDVLWTVLVVWIFCFLRPRASAFWLAVSAFAFAVLVECSQLYGGEGWFSRMRDTRIGRLALGYGFVWSDFPRYFVGAGLGGLLKGLLDSFYRSSEEIRSGNKA